MKAHRSLLLALLLHSCAGPAPAPAQTRTLVTSMGAWSSTVTYAVNDIVKNSSGARYISLQRNNLNHPLTDTSWWELFAAPAISGPAGAAATIAVGTTTTTAPGTNATVTNSGSSSAATLNFTIPRAVDGQNGAPGAAATVAVRTTTTTAPGTNATVTNVGTPNAAVLDVTVPRGADGQPGTPGAGVTNDTTVNDYVTLRTAAGGTDAYPSTCTPSLTTQSGKPYFRGSDCTMTPLSGGSPSSVMTGTTGQIAGYVTSGGVVSPLTPLAVVCAGNKVNGVRYAMCYPGADISIKIAAAMRDISGTDVNASVEINATGFSGPQTMSASPFALAGTGGVDFPYSGVIKFGAATDLPQDVPIVYANYWSIYGSGTSVGNGGRATHFIASPNFQRTYRTGTVTMGNNGPGATVTGAGTNWTSKMVGCALVAPATQPTSSNSNYGLIYAVNSPTSLTLDYQGQNGPNGAPAGSTYAIYCGMHVQGFGYAQYPDDFGITTKHAQIDCNNVDGCVGMMNWYGEENVYADDVAITGFTNIGLDVETTYSQNSGPYTGMTIFPGTAATAATISYVHRGGAAVNKGLINSSLNNAFSAQNIHVAADLHTLGDTMTDDHIETADVGISVGASTDCPVACPIPPSQAYAISLTRINLAAGGGTGVLLSNDFEHPRDYNIANIAVSAGGGWTDTLVDEDNACTDNSTLVGSYITSAGGSIAHSTSGSSPNCYAEQYLKDTTLMPIAPATLGGTSNSFPLRWFYNWWDGTQSQHGQVRAFIDNANITNPYTSLHFTHDIGSPSWQGYVFDTRITVPQIVATGAASAVQAGQVNWGGTISGQSIVVYVGGQKVYLPYALNASGQACASASSPANCGNFAAGSVAVAAGATSVVVNSSAVTATSQIMLTFDSSLGTRLGVTCNTTPTLPSVSARTAGSSFTLTTAAPATNPACFSYTITN